MIKKAIVTFITILMLLITTSCTSKPTVVNDDKIIVVVTFDAMYELTKAIAQDKVTITTMIPTGIEPHDFEPKAKDMAILNTANLFVYNGVEMESWVDKTLAALNNDELVVVEASLNVVLIPLGEDHHNDHDDEDDEDDHHHGEYDPHVWLSLPAVKVQAYNIKEALIMIDQDNASFYQENYDQFILDVDALYQEYLDKFSQVSDRHFVTSHAAFSYLAADFDLIQNSVTNVYAEGEPTAKQLAELVEYCREHNVKTIFTEKMGNTAISETLANEVGATVVKIYTIETAEDNMSYLERMSHNLNVLYESMN
ncbi:MAG: zinc ABC transporter substrate-binding protein [Erysipelotrichaceae bacterium]|nr:zinc ABC transporter substrate-binding protein [Erysipelotrichaceae bacterium]